MSHAKVGDVGESSAQTITRVEQITSSYKVAADTNDIMDEDHQATMLVGREGL